MLSDANQQRRWRRVEPGTFEEVRNFAADGTSRIGGEDDEDHFHYKSLSQRPIKALSYPYLCEHNVQMNAGNLPFDRYNNEDQNNPPPVFWQYQNDHHHHPLALAPGQSPAYYCGNPVTETEVGQQPQPQEALFQAASSTTSFKNFAGIESWANFVTAKETPLME